MGQAPALGKLITPALSGIILTSAWPDRTNERIFVITVTVQTPLDILFVSGPPLALPKQVVPHEVDCGRISATMCASKRIHVRLRVPARVHMRVLGCAYRTQQLRGNAAHHCWGFPAKSCVLQTPTAKCPNTSWTNGQMTSSTFEQTFATTVSRITTSCSNTARSQRPFRLRWSSEA